MCQKVLAKANKSNTNFHNQNIALAKYVNVKTDILNNSTKDPSYCSKYT